MTNQAEQQVNGEVDRQEGVRQIRPGFGRFLLCRDRLRNLDRGHDAHVPQDRVALDPPWQSALRRTGARHAWARDVRDREESARVEVPVVELIAARARITG